MMENEALIHLSEQFGKLAGIGRKSALRMAYAVLAFSDEEAREFDKLSLNMAIEKLGEWQRRLIVLRYFKDLSQTETAKCLGVTQVKISREEKKILKLLKEKMEA